MKILSDWYFGKPPKKGWWLTRCGPSEISWVMMRWDGRHWWYNRTDPSVLKHLEWRGLAFDPKTVREIGHTIDVPGERLWIVQTGGRP